MTFEEYRKLDAVALGRLIARGEIRAEDVLELALARTTEVNPRLNALTQLFERKAPTIARKPLSSPLSGTPFLIKDIGADVAGIARSAGSRLFKGTIAEADSAVVAAYRTGGLQLFGATNTPEMGLAFVTEPLATGRTLNPWRSDRTCGGSSGGAASAVASGIVPAAHASDGAGSIRVPASCCGLFGLKPSRGRVSMAPAGESWMGLAAQHAVTRSVRDSAALLDIACTPQTGDPYWQAPPALPFLSVIEQAPGPLRIAFTAASLGDSAIEPDCAEAVKDAARLCQELGHQVEEAAPRLAFEAMSCDALVLIAASTAASLEQHGRQRGVPIEADEVETLTWRMFELGRNTNAAQLELASRRLHSFARQLALFFERFDVLMLATLSSKPVELGALNTNGDPDAYLSAAYRFSPNTLAFNVSGQPAMSVPLHWSSDGLPIGVQFAARMGAEALLFQLAAELERARPWFHRTPP